MCKCSQENCNLEVFESRDKCILHCEKDDWYDDINKNWDKSKRNTNLFWKKIQEDLDKKYEESFYEPEVINEIYIYDNLIFPKFQEDIPYNKYEDNQVELGTNFYSYFWFTGDEGGYREELNTIISELNVSFKNCKFLDNVELSRYNFLKDLDFERCEFKKDLTLKKMIIEGNIELCDVKINGKLDLSETIFKDFSKVRIKDCEVKNADFCNTKFSNLADFFQTKFNEVNFKRTTFKDISVFTKVTFKDDIDFEYTTFEKLAQFKETIFEKKLNFEDTIIKDKINFLKTKTVNNENLKPENIANRETARIIKDSFEQQNNIIEANKFYALEMKEREKELERDLKEGKNIFEWLVFKVHGLSSNHSQNWLLTLFWIVIFTLNYSFLNCISQNNENHLIFFSLISMIVLYVIADFLNDYIDDKFLHFTIMIIFSFIYYLAYGFTSKDFYLKTFSNNLNPFSIMTELSKLDFSTMIYKITIAYLIYQLIISIRQNTRRK